MVAGEEVEQLCLIVVGQIHVSTGGLPAVFGIPDRRLTRRASPPAKWANSDARDPLHRYGFSAGVNSGGAWHVGGEASQFEALGRQRIGGGHR